MANKKLFAGITAAVAVLGVVAAAGTSNSFINIMGVSADSYTLTMDATGDNSLANITARGSKVVTTGGNELAVSATGFSAHATAFGTLATGGTLDFVDMITGVQSITVNFDGELKVNFGFEAGNYVRTNQPLATATEYEFGGQAPNYIGLVATKDTTIESIEVDYSCSGVATPTPTMYTKLETWGIVGSFNGWSESNSKYILTPNTSNQDLTCIEYEVEVSLNKGDTFKFRKDKAWTVQAKKSNWSKAEGSAIALGQIGFVNDADDCDMICYYTGTYHFYWKGVNNKWDDKTKTGGSWVDASSTKPAEKPTTIYYDNTTTKWSKVYAYAYVGDTINNAGWPGVEMTTTEFDGIYSLTVDIGTYYWVIFNDGGTNEEPAAMLPSNTTTAYSNGNWVTIDSLTTEPDPDTMVTIYFKVTNSNWLSDNAATAIYLWGDGSLKNANFPGVRMTKVGTNNQLWKFDLDLTLGYKNVIFCRVNPTGALTNWGAQTKDLKLSDRGEHNMFTLTWSGWGSNNGGSWSTYAG